MKNLKNAIEIDKRLIKLIKPIALERVSKKQKRDMLFYENHSFKQPNETRILSFKAFDNSIDSVFVCSHCSNGCNCYIVIYKDGEAKKINEHSNDFKHLLDIQMQRRYEARKFIQMELQTNPNATTQEIITKYIKYVKTIDPLTPPKKYLNHIVKSFKSDMLGIVPTTPDQINIEELRIKYPGFVREKLIYYDKGKEKHSLVLFNDFQLAQLQEEHITLLGDGTFTYVPPIYEQQYTFHKTIGSRAIPVMFVLCQSKSKEMYKSLFKYMKDKLHVDLVKFQSDFEQASRNAATEIYPDIQLSGCMFHFDKALMDQTKDKQIYTLYNNSLEINKIIRSYMSLCYVPESQIKTYLDVIVKMIEEIKDDDIKEKMRQYHGYFTYTWVDNLFKPNTWIQLNDIRTRTNNWSESFHASYGRRFKRSHPNLYIAINEMKDCMINYEYEYNDYMNNPTDYHIPDAILYTNELINVISQRETTYKTNPEEYLFALSTINLKLVLRMEKEVLLENNGDQRRIKEIDKILSEESRLSLLEEEIDEEGVKKEKNKMKAITNYHIEKRKKYLKTLIKENKPLKRRIRQETLLNEVEINELSTTLMDITNNKELMEEEENVEIDEGEEDILEQMDDLIDNEDNYSFQND